jgi:hypothetical protein
MQKGNGSLSLEDVVPWSIIYGAQNARHANEMLAIRAAYHDLALDMLDMLLHVPRSKDLGNPASPARQQWSKIAHLITADDMAAATERVNACMNLKFGYECPYSKADIVLRAALLWATGCAP